MFGTCLWGVGGGNIEGMVAFERAFAAGFKYKWHEQGQAGETSQNPWSSEHALEFGFALAFDVAFYVAKVQTHVREMFDFYRLLWSKSKFGPVPKGGGYGQRAVGLPFGALGIRTLFDCFATKAQ